MEIILSVIVYLLFCLIFLFGINREEIWSRDECYKRLNSMRGIMALEIIIGHVVRYEHSYLVPFGKFMLVAVGFFFFVSGWGLCRSFHEKPQYLNSFIRTRFLYLAGVAFVALGVIAIVDTISPVKTDYSSYSPVLGTIIQNIFVRTNWYVRELLLLYLLFYFIYKYVPKHQLLFLTISILIVSCGLYRLGYVRCWYASILAFPMGFFVYEKFYEIIAVLRSKKGIIIIGGFGALGLCSILVGENNFAVSLLTNNSLCICAIMILVLFLGNFYTYNKVKLFLNKYATELFLFQFIFLAIAERLGWNYWIRMVFVISMDVILCVFVHPVMQMLKRLCSK